MKIYLASGNRHKRDELMRIFYPHTIVIPSDEGIAFDPEETGVTYFENALIKARSLYEITGEAALADDSGISVDALEGRPGIHSARFGSENGTKLTDLQRNNLLLSHMQGKTDRTARFVCNMVLYLGPERFISAQETMEGTLMESAQGTGGFGYDPVLYIPEAGCTVAELSPETKDALSHRGKAARKIRAMMDCLSS